MNVLYVSVSFYMKTDTDVSTKPAIGFNNGDLTSRRPLRKVDFEKDVIAVFTPCKHIDSYATDINNQEIPARHDRTHRFFFAI